MEKQTPMMKQYLTLKEEYSDCLLFFRLGDFYEMFFEDAILAARELDLTLTTRDRNKAKENRVPMCGVPYHSAQGYIAKLIANGHKVAICEQTQDPALAKGIVERSVVKVITPGTVTDSTMLEEGKNNYIACLWVGNDAAGVCFADVTTGDVSLTYFEGETAIREALGEILRYEPKEVLLSPQATVSIVIKQLRRQEGVRLEPVPETLFEDEFCFTQVDKQFPNQRKGLPTGAMSALRATGALLYFLHQTQKTNLSHMKELHFYSGEEFMQLDPVVRSNLELTKTIRSKEKKGSLLSVLDKTKTPMGGRLLCFWLERPRLSAGSINARLDAVEELKENGIKRTAIADMLRNVSDLERLVGRVSFGSAGAKDLQALAVGLSQLPLVREALGTPDTAMLKTMVGELDDLPELCEQIFSAIADEPPLSVKDGGMIRDGYNEEVDRLRHILKNSRGIMAGIETREREETGIKNLKIGYNKVFGYFLEVSKSHYERVPDTYIRKQTLVNCERYITQELKDMEHSILSAQDSIEALEFRLFSELRNQVATQITRIQESALAVAKLDVLISFATVAEEQNYCRPQVDHSDVIHIQDGRHPVVEQMLKDSLFVPNDTVLDANEQRAIILTGPNMAGKSTYMRQVALIVLMAQVGSFVPAQSAQIGIVDRIFTRIGASDDLAGGQSTFMVEMTEVAQMLEAATSRSLLILDEVGRGTSTYDGMAIARAVLERCADFDKLGAKTLFATHYHEITSLEEQMPGVKNANILAKKRGDEVTFLHKIVKGKADQSYAIEVAKLAGVPQEVVERSREILFELEQQGAKVHSHSPVLQDEAKQATENEQELLEKLRNVSVETLTPLEAMNLLYQMKQTLM